MPKSTVTRNRPLLDVSGVAEYLGTTCRHVRRLVAERSIPHHKVGALLRFDPDVIDGWLSEHQRGPAVPSSYATAAPSTASTSRGTDSISSASPARSGRASDPTPHELRLDS